MALYSNPGKVNIENVISSTLANGGGMNSTQKDGYVHNTVYSRGNDWHLSWDQRPDGSVENVHSTKDGTPYMDYGN